MVHTIKTGQTEESVESISFLEVSKRERKKAKLVSFVL